MEHQKILNLLNEPNLWQENVTLSLIIQRQVMIQ